MRKSLLSAGEFFADQLVDDLAIRGLAREGAHHSFHHAPHVLGSAGAGLGDRGLPRRLNLLDTRRRRRVPLQDDEFRALLVDEVLATAVLELFDRIAALL